MAADTADIDIDELAAAVVDRLDGGQRIGDKLVLSRRQAIALAGGGLSLAALGIGTGEVAAADGTADESVGAVGAQGDSVDVYLDQLLDDSGDEVLNVDDTGTANATARGWEFDSIDTGSITGAWDVFADISKIDSGSISISSGGQGQPVTGYTLSSQSAVILPLAHFDTTETGNGSVDISWLMGSEGTNTGELSVEVVSKFTGDIDIYIYNEAANQYTVHYAVWEIIP